MLRLARAAAFVLVPATLLAQRPTGTLVVSNMNDHTATVIDAATGRVHATLPTGEGPHEVAVSHDGRTALVSNYGLSEAQARRFFRRETTIRLGLSGQARLVENASINIGSRFAGD